MSVPVAPASSFLENLSHFIQYKAGQASLPDGVLDSIRILQQELAILRSQLIDLIKYDHMEYLEDMMSQITTIITEAEDEVDGYLLRYVGVPVKRPATWRLPFRKSSEPHLRQALLNVGLRIRAVGVEVSRIHETRVKKGTQARDYHTIHYDDGSPNSNQALVTQIEEEHVIGLDDESKDLTELLTKETDHLKVISMAGMLGLGKTTLARKLYNDPDIQRHFKIRVWVSVSLKYGVREVLLKILASFTFVNEAVYYMAEEDLVRYLYKELDGKQYLIVLDDVWEPADWDRFKDCFPNNKRCGVLITTRNELVAKHSNRGHPYYVYRPDFLPLLACRALLRWRVFQTDTCPSDDLREYEENIARKCDGLPLAVVAIAGVLVKHKERVAWWKEVADSVRDYIARDYDQTDKAVVLMYKNLPNYLKSCFLYLGVFPAEFNISAWELVQMWIGEGLVHPHGNSSVEDTAEQYLQELGVRSLIVVTKRSSKDKIKSCRMPITMHAFCHSQAKKENLFSVSTQGLNLNDHYRRISTSNIESVLDILSGSYNSLRSLIAYDGGNLLEESKLDSRLLSKFKLLRVLRTHQPFISTRFLDSLVLLTYLAISFNGSSLPSTLCNLWNLQTLVIKTTSHNLEIGAGILKMPRFRHLHSNSSIIFTSHVRDMAFHGKNVQTLSTISPGSCRNDIFDGTPELRKLGIRGRLESATAVFDSVGKLVCLESLKLINDDHSPKPYQLPSKENFPCQLRKLTLWHTQLDWEEMIELGKLENLEILKLKDRAFQGKEWRITNTCFRRLKYLYIGITDLEVWEASGDCFPELKNVVLDHCDQLQGIPLSLAGITSFQSLVLRLTNDQVVSSARRIEDLKIEEAEETFKRNTFKLTLES